MKISEVFDLCKEIIGRDIRYIRELEENIFEVHEVKHKFIIKYIITIENGKLRVLEERETKKVDD